MSPGLPLLPPQIGADALEAVQGALLYDRQLDIQYARTTEGEPHPIRLHPLGLVQRGPISYLVATAFEYKDVRLYAVHRIREAAIAGDPARRPPGFSLDEFINTGALHFSDGKTIRLEALVTDWLAELLKESPLATDQNLVTEGKRVRLAATLTDSWQLDWWILSYADAVEVLEPVELRDRISKALKAAARHYQRRHHKPV